MSHLIDEMNTGGYYLTNFTRSRWLIFENGFAALQSDRPFLNFGWTLTFYYDRQKKQFYAYISGTKVLLMYTLTPDPSFIASTNNDYQIVLYNDGSMYLPSLKKYVSANNLGLFPTPIHSWLYTTFPVPFDHQIPSFWNIDKYPQTPQEDGNNVFNKDFCEDSTNCDGPEGSGRCTSHSILFANCNNAGAHPEGTDGSRIWCMRGDKPDHQYKELCAKADPSVIDARVNLLDNIKCKFHRRQTFCNVDGTTSWKLFEDWKKGVPSRDSTEGMWSPFSRETRDSEAVKDFCGQHDTRSGKPQYALNDTGCKEWCEANQELCDDVKVNYCKEYPGYADCGQLCLTEGCRQNMVDYCKGENLTKASCRKFCEDEGINCDKALEDYCQKLSEEEMFKSDICGCFMKPSFYEGIFEKVKVPGQEQTALKNCYYARCASSNMLPYAYKKEKIECPDVMNCINTTKITNLGTIKGNVTVNESIHCDKVILEEGACRAEQVLDSKKKSCISCADNEFINSTTKQCESCPSTSVINASRTGCEVCAKNAVPSSNQRRCIQCINSVASGGKCVPCKSGEVVKNGMCVKPQTECTGSTVLTSNLKSCEKCPNGTVPNRSHSECVKECPPSFILDNKQENCIKMDCGDTAFFDIDTDKCVDCPEGLKPNKNGDKCVEPSSALFTVGKVIGAIFAIAVVAFVVMTVIRSIKKKEI